jgi:hypothetical protein
MAHSIEILIPEGKMVDRAAELLSALRSTFPQARVTSKYEGMSDWLWLYGVGAPDRDKARKHQVKNGRHVWLWDLGYFDRRNHMRCSIDHDHPQNWLDRTPLDTARWNSLGVKLREDCDPTGHILLIGLGRKSRAYLHEEEWERLRLITLRNRFPNSEIIYRPKPGSGPPINLGCSMDATSTIEQLLKGCALVSCRHSNVACDAAVAGVPFECDDGAAMWLQAKPFTVENRLEFLRRLAWWQWKPSEVKQAWNFVQKVVA